MFIEIRFKKSEFLKGFLIYLFSAFSFNRDLNRGYLVYMFSLRFSGSKFLTNLQRQFGVSKIFRSQVFARLFRKCVTYILGCSFIETCLLKG